MKSEVITYRHRHIEHIDVIRKLKLITYTRRRVKRKKKNNPKLKGNSLEY